MEGIRRLREFLGKSPSVVYPDEVFEYVDAIEKEVEGRYVELPTDADGIPIYVSDRLVRLIDGMETEVVVTVRGVSESTVFFVYADDEGRYGLVHYECESRMFRHCKPPTIRDVLEKALNKAASLDRDEGYRPSAEDIANIVNETAPKLRLVNNEE